MAFKVIYNSQVSKIIVIILVAVLLLFTYQINEPIKVKAEPFTLTIAAFSALVGIVLTAIAGYTITNEYNLTYGQLTTIYDNVMNKLSTSDKAEFIAALGSFALTGIISESLIDQLKIGVIGSEVVSEVIEQNKTNYNKFDATINDLEQFLNEPYNTDYKNQTLKNYYSFNENWIIGSTIYINDYSLQNYTNFNYSNYQITEISNKKFIKANLNYTSISQSKTYISQIYIKYALLDNLNNILHTFTIANTIPASYYGNNTTSINIAGTIENNYEPFITIPNYLPTIPGIQDLDITQVPPIAVPTDVAIDIPAFPTDPAIDTPITIPIPVVATGDNVIDVPIDNVGTVDEPIDPAIPGTGIGTLAPTMPTDVALDFSPLLDLGLSNKFPFSIPFDIVGIMSVFSGTSRTPPEFSLPFVQDITLDFDLSDFEPVAMMSRVFFLILFIIALAFATKRLLF